MSVHLIERDCLCVFTPQLQSPALGACSERRMEINLVNAQISRLLEVKPALILHVHPFVSPSLSLPVATPFLPASLSPVHLLLFDSFHYGPGTSSACPAKTGR